MNLELLADVRARNAAAREEEQNRNAERGAISPETPSSPPPGAWGGQTDTTKGTPG